MQDAVSATAYQDKPATYFGHARDEIAPLLPAMAGRVLEIGCGAGATMRWLRTVRAVEYAAGVELMPDAAEAARSVFDHVATGSVEAPGALGGPGAFDLILALDVLEHLTDPEGVVAMLAGRLAPGGCLIVSLPNVGHASVAWPLLTAGRWRYTDEGILDRTHLRFFDETSARALLGAPPLAVDRVDYVRRVPLVDRVGPRWLRWQAQKLGARVLPGHLTAWQFLIRARRAEA
jgi:SAM-dependent methyltransferase